MPEEQAAQTAHAGDVLQKFSIPISIVLAGALIAGAVYMSGGVGSGSPTPGAQQKVDIKDVKVTDDTPYIGDKNAKVVLAYWSDFQCPFCKAVETGGVPQIPIEPAIPQIIEEYVNTGKVKIIFKDYAFLGPDSSIAALYGRSVWEKYPDKYYEWREAMYHAQDEEHGGFGNEASIVTLTRTISGLDADALKADVEQNRERYTQLMNDDQQEGAAFGIGGTPGFITGKILIPGAEQFATFKKEIDAQL
jgi:protein-disulfide isomerase